MRPQALDEPSAVPRGTHRKIVAAAWGNHTSPRARGQRNIQQPFPQPQDPLGDQDMPGVRGLAYADARFPRNCGANSCLTKISNEVGVEFCVVRFSSEAMCPEFSASVISIIDFAVLSDAPICLNASITCSFGTRTYESCGLPIARPMIPAASAILMLRSPSSSCVCEPLKSSSANRSAANVPMPRVAIM